MKRKEIDVSKKEAEVVCDIPEELRKMSKHMDDVAVKMDYYGGFNGEMKEKAAELLNASRMALDWADYIELESD